jgi:hypothetical protein
MSRVKRMGVSGMQEFVRRSALLGALAACAIGTSAVSAEARTTPAGGAGQTFGERSLEYVQPLNQTENGTGILIGGSPFCSLFTEGSVSGSPMTSGVFLNVIAYDCSSPGLCASAGGFVEMDDGLGEIVKEESGRVCFEVGSTTTTVKFRGTYTILGGFGVYSDATGTGSVTRTFVCDLSGGGLCSVTGHEGGSGEGDEGPFKKGNDPTHVLLCSPTLVQRGDGTTGNALQVPWTDYQAWLAAPTTHPEIPVGSIPARYAQDVGLTCDNLPGYRDSGQKVDEQGTIPDAQTGPLEGAIYPYWVKP